MSVVETKESLIILGTCNYILIGKEHNMCLFRKRRIMRMV